MPMAERLYWGITAEIDNANLDTVETGKKNKEDYNSPGFSPISEANLGS